jgi:hypothetical protein
LDIAAWLRGLGLAQYEPAFRENAIDSTVLRNLTAEVYWSGTVGACSTPSGPSAPRHLPRLRRQCDLTLNAGS